MSLYTLYNRALKRIKRLLNVFKQLEIKLYFTIFFLVITQKLKVQILF